MKCKDCKWWEKFGHFSFICPQGNRKYEGKCKRYPPFVYANIYQAPDKPYSSQCHSGGDERLSYSTDGIRVLTFQDDWCGEFSQRVKAKKRGGK